MTLTNWDPVSKEPVFKYSAVRIQKVEQSVPVQQGYHVIQFFDKSDGALEKIEETDTSPQVVKTMEEV